MQFLMLLQKTDVHSVWLGRGGRKKVENQGTSTDQPLNHAWNYSSINGIG